MGSASIDLAKRPVLTITRRQLQGYGATRYLAAKITASLTPVEKAGAAYVYALEPTIAAIRLYAERSRIRPTTQQTLSHILPALLARLDNIVPLSLEERPSELGKLAQQAIKAMRRTDKALSEMKATVASTGSSHGKRLG
jgi:hypothetical protein